MAENNNHLKNLNNEIINPATEEKQDLANTKIDSSNTILGNILSKLASIFTRQADGNQKTQLVDSSNTNFTSSNPLPTRDFPRDSDGSNYLSQHILNGGSDDMSVNGAVTPVEFSYTVPAGKKLNLRRGFITIEDGVVAFASGDFGAISSGITNGLEVSITPSGGAKQVLETWKTNRQIRDTMFDFDQSFKTDGHYTGRWTFTRDINEGGFVLTAGDKFSIIVQDDLSSMDYLSFRLKGRLSDV